MIIEKREVIDYVSITELPGLKATQEQLARLSQRYHFAKQFAEDKDVLEVACGSGIGLGYIAQVAEKVVGGDIDERNVGLAREYYKSGVRGKGSGIKSQEAGVKSQEIGVKSEESGLRIKEPGIKLKKLGVSSEKTGTTDNIEIEVMDAHELHFSDNTFDLVLIFEAIYYLNKPEKFISEADRVLRQNGNLIICSVNRDWEDFHPSPYTHKYFSVPELYALLSSKFKKVEIYGGFPIEQEGAKNKIISLIKRVAVNFNIIPGSLKSRAYLKRIFMGKLISLPDEVYEGMAPYEPPVPISSDIVNKDYKIIYAIARK